MGDRMTKGKKNKSFTKSTISLLKVLLIILFFGFSVYALKLIINTNDNKVVSLSSDTITYFIEEADKASLPKEQLNWQEIAAIEGVLDNKFTTYNSAETEKIAKMFYDNNNKVKSLETVISELKLSSWERRNVYLNLGKINNQSIRNITGGEDSEKDNFIQSIKDASIQNYKQNKIFPSITIAQAILESEWGKSDLASKYNNYFGIKADKSWKGQVVSFSTKENYNDVIKANFRAYTNIYDSIFDHGKFFSENDRYTKNGVFDANNYIEQARAIENAGYSTVKDKNGNLIYSEMLISIIKENNLMLIDKESEN